ncbi:MAG: hypothetical protein EHM58_11445 [Ignavibacteriae bacterium]|nr:MAG: hypothetical protein EHM58_11445 [Ignavibacteriota bacterium]
MIKDVKYWEEFEKKLIADTKPDYKKNMEIFKLMLEHARKVGAFPPKDPLEGIEVDIRIAKILNGLE